MNRGRLHSSQVSSHQSLPSLPRLFLKIRLRFKEKDRSDRCFRVVIRVREGGHPTPPRRAHMGHVLRYVVQCICPVAAQAV